MIRFEAVSKRYGRLGGRREPALREVDLRVRPGERVALVGPNGAGKSTVVGLAMGFLRPSAGRVRLGGLPPRRFVRTRGVGCLPESFDPPGRLRAEQYLRRRAVLDGVAGGSVRSRSREALERAGLSGAAEKRVRSLSRGNRQRLGVAQLLLRPRRALLLDEPWSGLDPGGKRMLRDVLSAVRRARPGTSVLMSSHDLGQVAAAADRAVLLVDGRAAEEVTLDDGGGDGARLEERIVARGCGRPSRAEKRT